MNWDVIQEKLHNLEPVSGGFSSAIRGLIKLPTGERAFVKIGNDENTRGWAHKEIAVYRFLAAHGYEHIGKLLAVNEDETAFATEAFTSEQGWDWSEIWTKARLDATLLAMDELAAIAVKDASYTNAEIFKSLLSNDDNGWIAIAESETLQTTFKGRMGDSQKLREIAQDFTHEAVRSSRFNVLDGRALVHLDVRADNCAWNAEKNMVKLVDWNWLTVGNRGIDLAAFMVHVYTSGLDMLPDYADRLDPAALHWMAGFWLKSGCTPIWPGGPAHLRDIQFKKGVSALELLSKLE